MNSNIGSIDLAKETSILRNKSGRLALQITLIVLFFGTSFWFIIHRTKEDGLLIGTLVTVALVIPFALLRRALSFIRKGEVVQARVVSVEISAMPPSSMTLEYQVGDKTYTKDVPKSRRVVELAKDAGYALIVVIPERPEDFIFLYKFAVYPWEISRIMRVQSGLRH